MIKKETRALGSQEPIDEAAAQAERHAEGWDLSDPFITRAEELLKRASLTTHFLIRDTLPIAGVGLLVGKPGDGKSWLAYDMALAVARARPWLVFRNGLRRRRDDAPRRAPVLVLNYDNPEAELARRFLRMGMSPKDQIFFHSRSREPGEDGEITPLLRLPDDLEVILRIIETIKPGLVIIDSLRQSHTLDEIKSTDMSRITACLGQMTSYGASVLALHHLRKGGGSSKERKERDASVEFDPDAEIRGSGELVASADVTLHVRMTNKLPGETAGILRVAKTRGWPLTIDSCDYKIQDVGDTTIVVPGGRMDNILDVIRKHGPIKRRDIQRKIGGLTASKLTEIVNLCLEFGKVKEVQPGGGGSRALVAVDPPEQTNGQEV